MTNLITEYNNNIIPVSTKGNTVSFDGNRFTINYGPPIQITDQNNNNMIVDDVILLDRGIIRVELHNHTLDIKVENPFTLAMTDQADKGKIDSPMAGVISTINVKVNDIVSKGTTLLLISAMKMENKIIAPIDGKVLAIHVKTNDQVSSGQLLVEISED